MLNWLNERIEFLQMEASGSYLHVGRAIVEHQDEKVK